MSTPTISTALELSAVIEGTIHEGPLPTPETPEQDTPTTEVPADTETRIAALKALWAKGTEDEESAWASLSVARVLKARTAYLAGLLGSKNGEANNKAAMRILDLAQNTVRPYFLAGKALAEAGFIMSTAAPTASEIEIADPIISKAQGGRKRVKADESDAGTSSGTGGTTGGDVPEDAPTGGPAPTTAPADDDVILADVITATEALMSTVKRFTREQGFPAIVADNLSDALAEVAALIDSHRVDGGDE